jgi:hypothetical protein
MPRPIDEELPENVRYRRLPERALRSGWLVDDDKKGRIVDELTKIIVRPPGRTVKQCPPPDPDLVSRVARTLIYADISQQRLDLARSRAGVTSIRVDVNIIAEAAARVVDRRAERARTALESDT